ncbi:uncharacterized protein LOC26535445 [Drosophila yakuba]|uniref:Gustatory receptor n=1 Tax=Drosophila yakuba TaxID=7245 RepID=A0A0R1DN72_DROYA|nr:uncharacterized protein LOC26535445 [Drosophila yakuba]KRJ98779.1 uncharacterized protein Dyak_GE28264 [Drosophila yakuba]
MNNSRILRTTNVMLLVMGYQRHWFEKKSHRFRFFLPSVVYIFGLGVVYAACFSQHFDTSSSTLNVLQDISPFLFGLIRMQLILGAKAFLYVIYSSVKSVSAVNSLLKALPIRNSEFKKDEGLAYVLLCSTFWILCCFVIYIAYEMKFEPPPVQDAMLGMALFFPHLILAGSLRLYIVFSWLSRGQLKELKKNVEEELSANLTKDTANIASTSVTVSTKSLENLKTKLEILGTSFLIFVQTLKYSMMFLFALYANCLLGGIYSFTYYWNTWSVLFDGRKRRIFYAANASIYACIVSDYICLMVVLFMMENERRNFIEAIGFLLAQRKLLSKKFRPIAKDLKGVLETKFCSKFVGPFQLNISYVSLVICVQMIIITLIVAIRHLKDEILLLKEEFSSTEDK